MTQPPHENPAKVSSRDFHRSSTQTAPGGRSVLGTNPIPMNMSRLLLLSLTSLVAAGASAAADFTPGNILVYRVGSSAGTDTLANTGNAVFIDEWTGAGDYVQSVATGIFASGTATSEGMLTRSPNGQYVTFTGYAATNGSSLAGTTGATINRTVGILGANGALTKTNFSDFASGNNPRSATTTNGTDLWMAGGAGGVRYGTTAGGSSTKLSTTVANIRDVEIFNNQLYVSTSSGSSVRIGSVGAGTPATTGNTITNLPGFISSTGSPYEFVLLDLDAGVAGVDTLYYSDDAANAIGKYSLVGGTWTARGTITAASVRGLAASVSGSTVTLFGSTGSSGAAGAGTVYGFTDATGYNSSVSGSAVSLFTNLTLQSELGSTGSSFAFRGIELVPSAVPEPASAAALAGAAMLGFAMNRRRRRA